MRSPNLTLFSEYLTCAIKDSKLSRAQLAHACGIDRSYITLLCAGKREPSVTVLLALEDAMTLEFNLIDAVTVMAELPTPSAGKGE